MISQHYSPLRYPGGKVSLYDFLKKMIIHNNVIDGIYAEGFAGGAGAALKLLMLEDVNEIYLNDSDIFIYKFWYCVLNNTEQLVKKIHDTPVSINEWKYRKEIVKSSDLKEFSDLELAFTTFFLNRCNRSGILKAGVIGGNEQSGNWKIDARYNKKDLIKRIELISCYKDRIKLFNKDILTFLKDISKEKHSSKDIFVYLDPPYVEQGKDLYLNYFNENDHKRLAKYLQKNFNYKWVTSYDDHELIHNIYKEVHKNIFEFNYFVNRTKIGRELLIASKNCKMINSYNHYSRKKAMQSSNEIDKFKRSVV